MLQHDASLAHNGFQVIEQLRVRNDSDTHSILCILVHDQALELLIPARAELLPLHLQHKDSFNASIQCLLP